jgi:hypothetical protein
MPQINVWCLPTDLTTKELDELEERIIAAAVSISVLGLNDKSDFLITFPYDLKRRGDEGEIMVQVSELWDKPERTPLVKAQLTRALGKTVKAMFPKALIAVRIDPLFNPKRDGFWMSDDPDDDNLE